MLKTIEVEGYTVSQAGMLQAVRRVNLIRDLQKNMKEYDNETLEALSLYPHIAGCVTPEITIEQFLNDMPEILLDKLTAAVVELNPHWFGQTEEQEKKTKPTPPASTTD